MFKQGQNFQGTSSLYVIVDKLGKDKINPLYGNYVYIDRKSAHDKTVELGENEFEFMTLEAYLFSLQYQIMELEHSKRVLTSFN